MKKSLLTILFAIAWFVHANSQGTWTRKADMLGSPRMNLLGFPLGTKGYITGGTFGGLTVTADCQEFNPATNTWTEKAPMSYAFRGGAAFAVGGRGYTTTGVNEAMFIQELLEYNALGNNWSILGLFPGEVRMYASGFSLEHSGYITCGSYINMQPLNDVWEWNQQSNLWTQRANLPGSIRSNAVAFSIGSNGYVFGGTDGSTYLNDLWEYDPGTDSWTQKASLPSQGRTDAVAFAIGDYGYLVGGWPNGGNALPEVWQYSALDDSWTQLPDFPGIPAGGGTAFTIGNLGYVVGGYGSTECWEFDPSGVGNQEFQVSDSRLHFSCYPNPVTESYTVNFDLPDAMNVKLDLYDMTGRKIYSLSTGLCKKGQNSQTYQTGEIHKGIYLIRMTLDNRHISANTKLVVR
jgi:N-acetylneuraminic acid mutarotase